MHNIDLNDLLQNGSRADLIAYCEWNDRNGAYNDADCDAEDIARPTIEDLRRIIRNWINEG